MIIVNKSILLILCLTILAIACTKKAVPTITARTTEPQKPVTADVMVKPDIETGRVVFTARCGRCHGLPELSKYSQQKWGTILVSMMPKARLTKEQEIHITAYINENAAK